VCVCVVVEGNTMKHTHTHAHTALCQESLSEMIQVIMSVP